MLMDENAFIKRLNFAIRKRGYNISQLARKMDVDRKTVDKWAKGRTSPTTVHIARLCVVLGISADWLLFGEKKTRGEEQL